MTELTLLTRSYCHLCDEMASGLLPLLEEFEASLNIIDVDEDPKLESLYGDKVPLLLHGETELCCYVLDSEKVFAYLQARQNLNS